MPVRMKEKKGPNAPLSPVDIIGTPTAAPEFEGMTGPGGRLQEQFRLQAQPGLAGGFAERMRAGGDIERLRERATSEGLSPQMQMMRQAQEQRAKEQGAGAGASAWGRMAMRGGLGGGARERLAGQAMRQTQRGLQDIGLQTGIESERQKLGLQERLPGMMLGQEGAILGAQQADVARQERAQLGNVVSQQANLQAKRQFAQERFRQQMETMGAERQAQAEQAGKK